MDKQLSVDDVIKKELDKVGMIKCSRCKTGTILRDTDDDYMCVNCGHVIYWSTHSPLTRQSNLLSNISPIKSKRI